MVIIRTLCLSGLCLICTVVAVEAQDDTNDIARTRFIATGRGIYAAALNPAGLAISRADDGVLLNYNISDETRDDGEWNFLLSMGNLGFAFQRDTSTQDGEEHRLNIYQIALAVGNQTIAIGSTNKWIERNRGEKVHHAVDVDIGMMLRPSQAISLAAVVRNPAEAQLTEGQKLQTSYRAGMGMLLGEGRLTLSGEGQWTEDMKTWRDVLFRAGLSLYPVQPLNLLVGWQGANSTTDSFWAGVYIGLGGISVGVLMHGGETGDILRFSGEFRAALQTVRF